MAARKAGELIDALNVTLDIQDGDMVTDVVVLMKNVLADGAVSVVVATSEATSWLEQLGLITAASDIIRQGRYEEQ